MRALPLLVVYCGLILAASVAGGLFPLVLRLTHRRLELLLSFVSGVMLGVAFLHMLPSAGEALGAVEPLLTWALAGFLAMFFMERFFRFHHHESTPEHESPHEHAQARPQTHDLTWTGAAVGLTVHSLIGGVALAAAAAAPAGPSGEGGAAGIGPEGALPGLAVFLAIFLHKPFDALTLSTLLAAGRWPRSAGHLINGLFALAVPAGAAVFCVLGAGREDLGVGAASTVGAALAFSAGTFLCIAAGDLLPELQFHQHDRVPLSVSLLAGLAVAWGASALEG
jgi:zinc and cadmium transporter